tara:strand:+ start:348 stop:1058 length:711 start_codon:yes stop_codon:yes gene_type:complete
MYFQKVFLFIFIIINNGCFKNCILFDENANNIYGIDVSHYQNSESPIDWKKVANNTSPKIQFAYIRTTMGKDGVDNDFKYNIEQARKNGIKVGVYHYYRPNENSTEQFENFLKNNQKIGDLPPVIDIEEKSDFGTKNLKIGILNFITLIELKYNVKPIIYAHQRFYNTYLLNSFKDYQLWIARHHGIKESPKNNQTNKKPFLFDQRCPIIWQYSGSGKIEGISGLVDLNIISQPIW